ncbi:hypothetical protein C8R42DRAFT_566642, partial [Lentinula raphanica]
IPSGALEGPSAVSSKNRSNAMNDYGSDSDDDHSNIRVTIVSSFNTPSHPPLPVLDPRTLKRLLVLPSPAHILSILEASKSLSSSRYPLITFIHSLSGVWPSKQDELRTHLSSWNGGGLVREIWRGWVRGGGLGSNIVSPEPKAANATDVDSHEEPWAPLLLLADLYSHGLVTMDDDEFFSSSTLTGIGSSTAHRNPLTLDEISTFTR